MTWSRFQQHFHHYPELGLSLDLSRLPIADDFLAAMGSAVGAAAGDVVCFGHTHVPWHRTVNGVYFVNTGSVGRPKDGDPRSGYVILDVPGDRVAVEIVRVAYDVERTASAILASDLPDAFADYLRTGGRK